MMNALKSLKKRHLLVLCALMLMFAMLLTACSDEPEVPVDTDPVETEPQATEPQATEPQATEPAATEPAATEPAETEPAETEPAETEPAETQPAETQPAETEPEGTEPEGTEPEGTEPEGTEPEGTEPEGTEPEGTEPEGTEPTVPMVTVNMKNYTIVYDDQANSRTAEMITAFAERIGTPLGINVEIGVDRWQEEGNREILIGLSDRVETNTSLQKTAGKFTYNISIIGQKIVVTAPTAELLEEALKYLEETYISKSAGDGKFQLPKGMDYTPAEFEHITIIDGGNCLFNVVYPKTATVGTPMSVCAIEIREFLQKHTNEEQEVEILNDYANSLGQFDLTKYSFVVGNTAYPRSAELANGLTYFNWKLSYLDRQFYLYCEDCASINVMKDMMIAMLQDGVYYEDSKTVRILVPEAQSGLFNEWCNEMPQYTPVEDDYDSRGKLKVTKLAIAEFSEGYYRLRLNNVSPAGATAYNQLMKDSGYTVYQERVSTVGSNTSTFTTYIGNKSVVHVYYIASEKGLRILACDKNDFVMYSTEPEALDEIVTTPTMTIMEMDYSKQSHQDNGLGLIFTLSDGSYIIYDGGYSYDTEKLYNYLNNYNKHASGEIVIRAWILTHPHLDHYGNYVSFAALHGRDVKLLNAVYQFDYEAALNPNMTAEGMANSAEMIKIIQAVDAATKMFGLIEKPKHIVPLAGQTMYFGDVSIEMLAGSEMLYNKDGTATSNQNDHSLITRLTIGGDTVLIMGDTASPTAHMRTIEKVYGEALKSSFMTAPHHGLNGSDSLYALVQPKYIIFHTDSIHYVRRTTTGDDSASANTLIIAQLALEEGVAERWLLETFYAGDGEVDIDGDGDADGYRTLMMPFMGSDYFESNFDKGDYDNDQDADNWDDILGSKT